MRRLRSVSEFLKLPRLSPKRAVVTPADPPENESASAKARVRRRKELDSGFQGNDCRGRLALTLFCVAAALAACNSEVLQKQAEQIRQQETEIARQREEISALLAAQKAQEQQRRDCNRAFRDYFEKAQATTDREKAIALYRSGLALCPDDEVAHYELGKVFAEGGRHADAEREFEAALKINPGFLDAKSQLDTVRKHK